MLFKKMYMETHHWSVSMGSELELAEVYVMVDIYLHVGGYQRDCTDQIGQPTPPPCTGLQMT